MRDIGNLYVQRTKRRLFIGCISTLVSIPVGCCCLVLLATVIFPALDGIAAGGNENTATLVIVGVGLLSLVGLIGIPLVALIVLTLRRTRALDTIFTPLGLTGSAYMLYGRHYQGQIGGREVDIYIYRGPTVEIRLKTTVLTRAQVLPKGSLPASVAGMFDKQPIATDNPALEAFSIYPQDEAWVRNLLTDPRSVDSIRTLMTLGANWAIFRRVEIQPGEVLLHLYRSHQFFGNSVELNAAQTWLAALQSLAQAAESQPKPEVTAQPFSASSRQSRQKMSYFLVYAVVFIVFIMPLCFIAIGVIAFLIASLN